MRLTIYTLLVLLPLLGFSGVLSAQDGAQLGVSTPSGYAKLSKDNLDVIVVVGAPVTYGEVAPRVVFAPSGFSALLQQATPVESAQKVQLAVYPNPVVSGKVELRFTGEAFHGRCLMTLHTLQGSLALRAVGEPDGSGALRLDIGTLPAGLYLLRVAEVNGNRWGAQRVVVLR